LFGRPREGCWELAAFAVERKTVSDYLDTMQDPVRSQRQAKVQETLRSVGFRVVVVLEGLRELALLHERDRAALLTHAYTAATEVVTTRSIVETGEYLEALCGKCATHEGWSLTALQVLLDVHYTPDEATDCAHALRALGVPGPLADRVQVPLRQLLAYPANAIPALAKDLALQLGVTPRRAGQVLAALGHAVDFSSLPRKRARDGSAELFPESKGQGADAADDSPGETASLVEVSAQAPPLLRKKIIMDLRTVGLSTTNVEHGETWHLRLHNGRKLCLTVTWPPSIGPSKSDIHWLLITPAHERCGAELASACADGCRVTLCNSTHQAAYVVQALANIGLVEEGRPSFHCRAQHGLRGVLQLARDQGGATLPPKVAESVEDAVRQRGIESLVQLAAAFRNRPDWLQQLPLVGPGRFESLRHLLLQPPVCARSSIRKRWGANVLKGPLLGGALLGGSALGKASSVLT